ncbi:hypothetical protein C2S51_008642 [Perilla frutescens var. frutescens]|nr:hypothetical protein C2S51_008642 [Perilla frutescens var. frutescens]
MKRGPLGKFESRPHGFRTPMLTREDYLWKELESYVWKKTRGTEWNLRKLLRLWKKVEKAGGSRRDVDAAYDIAEKLPTFMRHKGDKYLERYIDYQVGDGGVFNVKAFLKDLLAWWHKKVYGKDYEDEKDASSEVGSDDVGVHDVARPSGVAKDPEYEIIFSSTNGFVNRIMARTRSSHSDSEATYSESSSRYVRNERPNLAQELAHMLKEVLPHQRSGWSFIVSQFRQMGSPRLKGNEGPLVTKEWIFDLERIFEHLECTDAENVSCAIFQLADDAGHWWQAQV